MIRTRRFLIWTTLALIAVVPVAAAVASPLLQWRSPIYIAAGFAGILGMVLLSVQPLLVGGYLPGLGGLRGRRFHFLAGGALVMVVVLHVVGLWITSPPDVIDALTFTSPTPFSAWGVIAMWAIFGAALLAVLRGRGTLTPTGWRKWHVALVAVAVIGSVIHALLIEGTMETVSKVGLCLFALSALGGTLAERLRRRYRAPSRR